MIKQVSPVTHITPQSPPVMILHGRADATVDYAQSTELADKYIAESVVGKTSLDDCRHIALATINKVDVLVSWNFRHIVNLTRIRGYNGVNLKNGYQTLEIRNPKDLIDYERI
jgi:hypothetical protein